MVKERGMGLWPAVVYVDPQIVNMQCAGNMSQWCFHDYCSACLQESGLSTR